MPRGKVDLVKYLEQKNSKPTRPRRNTAQERAVFAGWVNVEIPTADRDKVTAWGESTAYADSIHDLVVSGHKISIGFDADTEVFVASTFMTDPSSEMAGLMVSQRSLEFWRALLKLAYVHAEVLPSDYSGLVGRGGSDW